MLRIIFSIPMFLLRLIVSIPLSVVLFAWKIMVNNKQELFPLLNGEGEKEVTVTGKVVK